MPDRLGEDVFRAKRREDVSRERREDEEEWLREMRKPAAIQEDLWEMGRRRRVQQVLGARDFCSELEQVIQHDFAKSFPEALNNSAQPQMPMVNPQQLPVLPPLNVNQVLQTPPIPIADLADRCYSREEAVCRNKLATLYRLVDIFRWSQGIYNHITLRLPGTEPAEILINPFGLLYHEITASSLIKLTLEGRVLDQGDTHLGVNQAAYVLHSAIHEARPDVHCVLHLHTAVVAAIGSMKCGLLPLCQEAMIIGPVAYHDYQGILTDEAEKKSIVADLGDKNVMILRNHGFVVCGQSVEDTLHLAFHTIIACETQIRAARVGLDHLVVPSDEAALKAYRTARRGGGGVNRVEQNGAGGGHGTAAPPVWGIGELEWEAWCRVLDTAGYQTGQRYRQPQLLGQQLRRIALHQHHHSMHNLSSVATPSNGPGSVGEADEQQTGGLAAVRLAALRSRAKWLNSPNQYQKVHLLETGSTDHRPKVVTKWVQQCDSASTGGTPVKIHSPHQFSPCSSSGAGSGSDPREFRERQRRMKEVRLSGTISPGPVAHVLNAPTMGTESEGTEQRVSRADGGPVYIGTASKGIIDRAHQHNAQVYRRLYAPNPFAGGTDEALQQYLHDIQKSKSTPALSGALNADSREPTSSSPLQPQSPTIVTRDPPDSPSSYAIDGVSLMQAVKRAKMNGHSGRSASGDGLDSPPREERATANGNGLAERAKSGEKQQTGVMDAPKKKKRGIFASFGRRKKSGDARK